MQTLLSYCRKCSKMSLRSENKIESQISTTAPQTKLKSVTITLYLLMGNICPKNTSLMKPFFCY